MKKTVLITGASTGIGFEFCERYAKEGYHIILVSRSKDKLKEVATSLESQYSITTTVIAKDLTKDNAAKEVYEEVKKLDLTIDVLLNNAGMNNNGNFSDIPLESLQKEIMLNIVSLTNLTYLFLKDMIINKNGTVINLASIASFLPTPYESVYGATKAYVLSLTESLQYEYKDSNIRFFAICPGVTKTDLFKSAPIDFSKARTTKQVVDTTMKALTSKKHFVVDGFTNKAIAFATRLVPRKLILNMSGKEGRKMMFK